MELQYFSLFLTCVFCCSVVAQITENINQCSETERLHIATNIKAFRVSTSTLRITWSPPSNSDCFEDGLQYKVPYEVYTKSIKRINRKQNGEKSAPSGENPQITIHRLKENTIYKVTFTIISQAGLSRQSSTGKCNLQSGPTLNELVGICEFKCFSLANAVYLSWQQPSTDTGIKYKITKSLLNNGNCQKISEPSEENVVGWFNGSVWHVNDLLTFSTYKLKLTAGKGITPYVKKTIECRTEATRPSLAPKQINVLKVTNSSLTFTWEKIPCQSRKGKFKDYFFSFDGETDRCKENQVTFRNLTCGETYQFGVGVATGKGDGPISDAFNVTLTQPPDGVRNVEVSALYPSNLFVEWEPPFYTGCPGQILTYNVTYEVIKRGVCESMNANRGSIESISNTNVNIPNLHPLSTYAVHVVAQHPLAGPGSPIFENATTLGYAPGPVRNINFNLVSNKLTWQQPEIVGCPPLHHYIIEQQLIKTGLCDDLPGDRIHISSQENREYTVDELKSFSGYTFFITAAYDEIKGDEVGIDVLTPEAEPLSVPENVDIVAKTYNSLTFSWDLILCNATNGYITEYVFEIQDEFGAAVENAQLIPESPTLSRTVTITGLECNTTYMFQVAGRNSVGMSGYASLTGTTLSLSPGLITHLKFSVSSAIGFRVSWKKPSNKGCPKQSTCIIQYNIITSRSKCGEVTDQTVFSGEHKISEKRIDLTNLYPASTYNVTVYMTGYDKEIRQLSGPGRTTKKAPGIVTNLQVLSLSSTRLRVSWGEPADEACPRGTLQYKVSYKMINRGQCERVNEGEFMAYSQDIKQDLYDLVPLSTYFVTVTAGVVEDGSVDTYGIEYGIEAQTKATDPGLVTNFIINSPSSTSISLSWQRPDDPWCTDDSYIYEIEYQLQQKGQCNTPLQQPRNFTSTFLTNTVINDLNPYSSYNIYLRTTKNGRYGEYYNRNFRTNGTVPSGPPRNVHLNTSDSRALLFQWNPPKCGKTNGIIIGYDLHFTNEETEETNITNLNTTSKVFQHLLPYTNYSLTIAAETSDGLGPYSDEISTRTEEEAPGGPPINLQLKTPWKQSLKFQWDPPISADRHGEIIRYEYKLTGEDGWSDLDTVDVTQKVFDRLTPYTSYTVQIAAMTRAGIGPYCEAIIGRTKEAKPPPPSGLDIPTANNTSITLTWSVPDPPNGIIKKYFIMYWETAENETRSTNVTRNVNGGTTQYCMTELGSFTNYSIQVSAHTGGGKGKWSKKITAITKEGIPSKPLIISNSSNQTSLTLKWKPPMKPNGRILAYEMQYRPIFKPYDLSFKSTSSTNKFVRTHYSATINEIILTKSVFPSTKYEILITAKTSVGVGESSRIEMFTSPANDIDQPKQAQIISFTKTSLTIKILTVKSPYVITYQIGVKKIHREPIVKRFSENPSTYEVNPFNYIAAEILKSVVEVPFEIGDNATNGIYHNAPLKEDETYEIRVRAVSGAANESSYSEWGEPLLFSNVEKQHSEQAAGAAAGVSVVIVLLIALCVFLVVVIVYRRRRDRLKLAESHHGIESVEMVEKRHVKNDQMSSKPVKVLPSSSEPKTKKKPATAPKQDKVKVAAVKPRPQEEDDYKPVPVDQLSKYIQTHRAGYRYGDDEDDDKEDASGFTKEFNSIPFGQTHPCNISKNPDNVKKNRYLDIAAYDHSRVQLQLLDGKPHSDYINASFVKGYKTKVYIACQGPNSLTLSDMWRMIWEQKSAKVVMLTNLREKGKIKCERYWPVEVNTEQLYGTISVNMTSEECFANYTIRTFEIKKTNGDLPAREFKQFHYTTWPDMGVPQSATPLLNFMNVASSYTFEGAGPDIVHCSAGVGRTGTYIVIEAMLAMAAEESQIDVHASVSQLREDRIKMVQTEAQYEFIFDAVLQSVFCGDTSIMVTDLRTEYTSLLATDRNTGKSKLEEQFKTLEFLTEVPPPNAYKGGNLEENTDRNRFPDKIPPDRVRPYLMTPGTDGSTNYINAAYLDGYRFKAMYLATQMPLPNTVDDIWRMVYDYKSSTIVMLNDMDKDDATICQYWPESGSQCYGKIEVTLESMNKNEDEIVTRTFSVKPGGSSDVLTVQQFQYTGWPTGSDVPNNVTSFLSLANLVTQQYKGGPITVHCMDGIGRSGTFCALLSELDRMQKDKVVDVFQTVRTLRKGRPGVVETVRQYKLLFESAQANLEEYSIYENFNA